MNHRQILPERLNETRVLIEDLTKARAKLCELRARRADLISRAVDEHGTVDELGESIEGLKAALVELLAKSRQHLAEANARCAVLVKEKKAHGSRAIAREFNADPVKYPARGAKGWSAQLVEQLLRRV